MNTVMDDNKMLTLASNERIPLTPTMRLLLEINHMNHCSPATVSRGGVIFVNAEDVGWKPVVDSWIEKLEVRAVGVLVLLASIRWLEGACCFTHKLSDWLHCLPFTVMHGLSPSSAGRAESLTDFEHLLLCDICRLLSTGHS